MPKIIRILFVPVFLTATFLLQAQSSNKVWFVTWNGQPTPSSDISVQNIGTDGSASPISTGTANSFVSQTNFSPFNSPYDIAVDAAMGKVYVLDNNAQAVTPENIYSFNLTGTPAQIAASAQIIYTMPVPQADANAGIYPLLSGIALDATNHLLYFSQIDANTGTNSYIGRLSLASSSSSDVFSSNSNAPTFQTFYTGQLPSQGQAPIAIDATNLYLSAISGPNANDGIYVAPISGSGTFSEIITNSLNDNNYANGFVNGVASYSKSNLIYYLTFNAGIVNHNFDTSLNAIWVYNTVTHVRTKIGSGYQGYPNNIALDAANNRYYFTIGRDGTGNISPTNYQAIYTGTLGSTNAPTLFYTPTLNGQDIAGQPNAGKVSLQGIYIQDIPPSQPPVAVTDFVSAEKNLQINLPVVDLLTNDSDPNSYPLSITAVSNTSTNGGSVSLNGSFVSYLPVTNFTGRDQFTYTLANNQGGQAQGTVVVSVLSLNLPSTNHVSIAIAPSDKFLLFAGASSQAYVAQSATVVTGPWHDISIVLTAPASGLLEYNDVTPAISATRFYRFRTSP